MKKRIKKKRQTPEADESDDDRNQGGQQNLRRWILRAKKDKEKGGKGDSERES